MKNQTFNKWAGVFLLVSMFVVLTFAPTSAAPLAAAAVDGDGQLTVSPTTIAYGSGTATLTFTFTATGDFGAGSQVEIDVPNSWTPPKMAAGAGHVSWFSDTCTLSGGPPVAVGAGTMTTWGIFIDMASCTTGNSFRVTYSNVTPGPVSVTPYTFYALTDIGSGGGGLTLITLPSPTVSVDPKPLTVSSAGLTPANKIYDGGDGAALTIGSPALVGVVSPDVVTLNTGGAVAHFINHDVGMAKTVFISGLTLGGADAGNYVLTQPTRSANITQRPLTITAVTDTKTYDGGVSSTGIPNITVGALQGSDTANFTQTFANKNFGIGNKVLTPAGMVNDGNSGNNYSYTYVTFNTGTIHKLAITVTAETNTRVYNGNTSSAGIPLISPPLVGSDTSGFTQTFDTKNIGTNKTLTASGVVNDGNSGANYSYTFIADVTGVITAKTLTVSAAGLTPVNKVYNGTTSASLTIGTPSLVGVISPDVVTLNTGGAAGTFADRNIGAAKTVAISGLTLGGAGAGNYTLTQPTRSANITARPITISAVTDTKIYDGNANSVGVPTVTSGSIASGDSAPSWTQTFNSKHVGATKVLTPVGLVSDGNSGNNYSYTYATAGGIITKRSITVTAVSDSKTYDGNTSSVGVPTLSVGTPLASGDTEPVWMQAFANKNAGSGKTINPAGAVNDGNGGANYSYNFVPNTSGVISQLAITVTALTDTRFYDGTTSSSVAPSIVPDLVGTDTSAFIQTFDTPDAGVNKTLTPSGTVNDGNSGLNYAITFAAPITTGVINQADPKLTVTNPRVPYNGAAQPATVSSGTVAGTVSNIQYNGSATAPTNAGTYAVTADFAPTDTANYNSLVGASAGKFVITKERTTNGGFNTYVGASMIPKSWTKTNFAATDGKDTTTMKEGAASVKIAGQTGKTKTLSQTITFSGSAGDFFNFSFWAKASSLPSAGLCQAQVFFYNGGVLQVTKLLKCPAGANYNWKQAKLNFAAPVAYDKVVITFTYSKASGTIWFDLVSLVK